MSMIYYLLLCLVVVCCKLKVFFATERKKNKHTFFFVQFNYIDKPQEIIINKSYAIKTVLFSAAFRNIYIQNKRCVQICHRIDCPIFTHTRTHTHGHRHIQNVSSREIYFSINGFIGQHENLQKKKSIIHIKKYTAT